MKFLLSAFFSLSLTFVHAQYKNDNILFKTVDPTELATTLKQNPGYLLLDVRSKGEHYDTSAFVAMNIGRFRNAQNIDVRELSNRLHEIIDYKDRPVFVYCSHSQRSRRASKMLADSGFTKVFNINGGMTAFHYLDIKNEQAVKELFETADNYNIISPLQLCKEFAQGTKVIDVRPDSSFEHRTADAKLNAMGSFKKAIHIPLSDLETKAETFNKNQRIIFIDAFGTDAVKAAQLFSQKGFSDIAVMIEGIDRWLLTDAQKLTCKNEYTSPVSYKVITASELGRWKQSYVALDIRSTEEFTNTHTDAFRNIGTLHHAINIPFADLNEFSDQLKTYKQMPVVIYEFGGGKNAFAAAEMLTKNGFRNVQVLAGGLFNVRWTAANVKGQKHLSKLVTGVPDANL